MLEGKRSGGFEIDVRQLLSVLGTFGGGTEESCENQSERLFCKHLNYTVVKKKDGLIAPSRSDLRFTAQRRFALHNIGGDGGGTVSET